MKMTAFEKRFLLMFSLFKPVEIESPLENKNLCRKYSERIIYIIINKMFLSGNVKKCI